MAEILTPGVRIKIADTETAGLRGPDEHGSGVAEVAWLEIDRDLNHIDFKDSLLNPGRAMEPEASKVNGLTDDMLADKPTLAEYYAANWDSSPTVVIAHNKGFDLKFLAPHIHILKGSLCTLALARAYLPEAPNHKLATLADYLNLKRGEAHRAGGDVYTSYNLLLKLIEISGRTLEQLLQLHSKPTVLTQMPFGDYKGKRFSEIPVGYLDWIISKGDDFPVDVLHSAKQARKMK